MHVRPVRGGPRRALWTLLAVTGLLLGTAVATTPAAAAPGTATAGPQSKTPSGAAAGPRSKTPSSATAGPQSKADRTVARPPADAATSRNTVAAAKNKVLAGQNGNLSIITPQGDLLMYYHHGWQDGTANFSPGYDHGDGWNAFAHVISFGVNNSYDNLYLAVTQDGRMYAYYWSHYWQYWVNPNGTLVGSGWQNTTKLLSGGNNGNDNIVYRITTDGKLWWYMYSGVPEQGGWWSRSGVGSQIGTGWGVYRHVAVTGGMFYGARSNGALDFLYYPSMYSGDPGWYNNGVAEQIGDGWYGGNCGFQTVQGGGHGSGGTVLYAVDGSGRLRWFAHYQDHNGHNWVPVGNCGAIVGIGWM